MTVTYKSLEGSCKVQDSKYEIRNTRYEIRDSISKLANHIVELKTCVLASPNCLIKDHPYMILLQINVVSSLIKWFYNGKIMD